jgi:hypothetical protein
VLWAEQLLVKASHGLNPVTAFNKSLMQALDLWDRTEIKQRESSSGNLNSGNQLNLAQPMLGQFAHQWKTSLKAVIATIHFSISTDPTQNCVRTYHDSVPHQDFFDRP